MGRFWSKGRSGNALPPDPSWRRVQVRPRDGERDRREGRGMTMADIDTSTPWDDLTPDQKTDRLKFLIGALVTWLPRELGSDNIEAFLRMLNGKPKEPTP